MCGRFATTYTGTALAELFSLPFVPDIEPRYNIAPSQPVVAIRTDAATGQRERAHLKWGLIPAWAKDAAIGHRLINARAETLSEKPSFRNAFKRRRCLVPASGFYEWSKTADGKQPVFIRMVREQPFAMAGLWENWQAPDGSAVQSCTLITTTAKDLLRPVHHRMPVIVPEHEFERWLDPRQQDAAALQTLLRPYAADAMKYFPVSTHVNNPRNEGPDCIAPLA